MPVKMPIRTAIPEGGQGSAPECVLIENMLLFMVLYGAEGSKIQGGFPVLFLGPILFGKGYGNGISESIDQKSHRSSFETCRDTLQGSNAV